MLDPLQYKAKQAIDEIKNAKSLDEVFGIMSRDKVFDVWKNVLSGKFQHGDTRFDYGIEGITDKTRYLGVSRKELTEAGITNLSNPKTAIPSVLNYIKNNYWDNLFVSKINNPKISIQLADANFRQGPGGWLWPLQGVRRQKLLNEAEEISDAVRKASKEATKITQFNPSMYFPDLYKYKGNEREAYIKNVINNLNADEQNKFSQYLYKYRQLILENPNRMIGSQGEGDKRRLNILNFQIEQALKKQTGQPKTNEE